MEARKRCDITISMDCDGQDDIACSEQMVDEYLKGNEIVYGVRNDRSSDTGFSVSISRMSDTFCAAATP